MLSPNSEIAGRETVPFKSESDSSRFDLILVVPPFNRGRAADASLYLTAQVLFRNRSSCQENVCLLSQSIEKGSASQHRYRSDAGKKGVKKSWPDNLEGAQFGYFNDANPGYYWSAKVELLRIVKKSTITPTLNG
jgi:hypothetical protein